MANPAPLSICEWIFGGRPLLRITDMIGVAGYDAIELAGEPQREDRFRLAEELGDLEVSGITSVASWPTRDLTHADRFARRHALEYLKQCVDLAAEVGAAVVGFVPTAVGRVDVLTSYRQEWDFAIEGLRELAFYGGERGVQVAIEAVNRYETHLVNRVDQALELADDSDVEGIGVIADTFHMQIEEVDPLAAVASAGGRLLALHLADSTRRGLGHGGLDVGPLVARARETGRRVPLVMEPTAPGPNPFCADKGVEAMAMLDVYVADSAIVVHRLNRSFAGDVEQRRKERACALHAADEAGG
jgi:D-psicose/D-tagatose/L-ribulose 3-epimerase